MRLARLNNGHGFGRKILFGIATALFRHPPYDVVKMLTYRPEFLGGPLNALSQAVMRGPSQWEVWERELFAAFVSRENQCPF
jgi:hypothetical protein